MLKQVAASLMIVGTAGAFLSGVCLGGNEAQAATVLLLPDPGSMQPATIIVDPKSADRDTVLVCSSISQVSTGGCSLTTWSKTGLRRP
jgi:hypothetical protein